MADERVLRFEHFRIDLRNECLWRGTEQLPLTPKAFAVLRYLVEHPGQLVSKAALFNAVWPDTAVGDAVLTVGIGELRKALQDDPQAPRFIETVHRRGYRFLGKVVSDQFLAGSPLPATFPNAQLATGHGQRATHLVGRETELAQLHSWLGKALGGGRQIVFVTGEPGIGKTTIVEAFLEQIAAVGHCGIGQGQCIEHYGVGEAYLPVFAVLDQLCRAPGASRLREILSHYAPTWLVQMPGLLDTAALKALQQRTQGATRERMLREMAEAVEALTAEQPLILVFEDLHWSDYATLDLLSSLARRRQPARLLVIGTYRPTDAAVREHPLEALTQDLQLHRQCEELPLGRLSEAAVEEYLALALPRHQLPAILAGALHRRTSGNPLFLVNVIQDWISREVLVEVEGRWELHGAVEDAAGTVPPNLHQLIEQQLASLSLPDRRLLEAASVVGEEFSAALIAAVVGEEVEVVEERYEGMVRRAQVLEARGTAEWPDGTVAACYGFVHALYQEVLYEWVPVGRRARLHRQIGQRLEAAYSGQTEEVAAELAVHFEQGREYERAVRYLEQAAENALRRSANREASEYFKKGLSLLKTLPLTPERNQQELRIQTSLGPALMALKGTAAPEVERAYTRAWELSQQVGDTLQLFPVMRGLFASAIMRGKLELGHKLAAQLMRIAQQSQDSALLLQAHYALGMTLYRVGEFVPAREHLEQSFTFYDPHRHFSHALRYGGSDPGVGCLCFLAWTLWQLGYPDQALQRGHEALTYAQELSHPYSLAFALNFTAWIQKLRRERTSAQGHAEAAIAIATEHGFTQMFALGTILRGWAFAAPGHEEERIQQMHQGLEAWQATGAEDGRPYFLALLAEAYESVGQPQEGLRLVDESLAAVRKNGERYYEAELYRLKGQLTLQKWQVSSDKCQGQIRQQARGKSQKATISNPQHPAPSTHEEAEAYFLKAVETARHQNAKSWELRATISLSRLWQQQDKREEARQLLAEIYDWFTEGFDTVDLQEANELLTALA